MVETPPEVCRAKNWGIRKWDLGLSPTSSSPSRRGTSNLQYTFIASLHLWIINFLYLLNRESTKIVWTKNRSMNSRKGGESKTLGGCLRVCVYLWVSLFSTGAEAVAKKPLPPQGWRQRQSLTVKHGTFGVGKVFVQFSEASKPTGSSHSIIRISQPYQLTSQCKKAEKDGP